ncbi:MAG: hypothetical protein NDI84_04145 [Steroidobacteraceae bacterium]|nr:hypothetical protein [Steroidobacteraceae bacterium]
MAHIRRLAHGAVIMSVLGSFTGVMLAPTAMAGERPALKTALDHQAGTQPFVDALISFDDAVDQNRGKAPADAPGKLKAIEARAPAAKQAMRSLAQRLTKNGEVDAFNDLVAATARKDGLPNIVAELEKAGGAHAVLLSMDKLIDAEVGARRKVGGSPSARLLEQARGIGMLELIGIQDAEAGTICSIFIYTITFGYGDKANYRMCMGGAR